MFDVNLKVDGQDCTDFYYLQSLRLYMPYKMIFASKTYLCVCLVYLLKLLTFKNILYLLAKGVRSTRFSINGFLGSGVRHKHCKNDYYLIRSQLKQLG